MLHLNTNNQRILSQALTTAGVEHLQKQCLSGYYPDFIFPGYKLIVEIENNKHSGNLYNKAEQKNSNQEQDDHLTELGYQIVRYSSQAVKNSTKGVVLSIKRYLTSKLEAK